MLKSLLFFIVVLLSFPTLSQGVITYESENHNICEFDLETKEYSNCETIDAAVTFSIDYLNEIIWVSFNGNVQQLVITSYSVSELNDNILSFVVHVDGTEDEFSLIVLDLEEDILEVFPPESSNYNVFQFFISNIYESE